MVKIGYANFTKGRALVVQPEGIFDVKDDLEAGWAGDQLKTIMRRRHDAGFPM